MYSYYFISVSTIAGKDLLAISQVPNTTFLQVKNEVRERRACVPVSVRAMKNT
jgi:hypothetical protein